MVGSATARPGNLPSELTSFIGRRHQLQDVKAALTRARTVTLLGPGGVGKTRLALRTASDLRRGIRDGAWLVELDKLQDPALVTKAVMTSLGLRDELSRWPVSTLIDYVRSKEILLVLDNCEHLLDACALIVDAILREAPGVRVLATSRQPLGVVGEALIQVEPLSVPRDGDDVSADAVAESDAVALLVQRARDSGAGFEVNEKNRAVVVELVRRLDGIPLAIELAAVRLRTLGLDELTERLNDRFVLLVGGSRTAPPRHQTLEATIAWSHELLDERDRTVLRRLSVFAGSFSLNAAETVTASGRVAPTHVMDAVASLVDRSFAIREGTTERARYRLHESMREFGSLRLLEADEVAMGRDAHLAFFAQLCRPTGKARGTADPTGTLARFDRLELEADNIRAALRHSLTDPSRVAVGLAMAAGLGQYWRTRAVSEGVYWIDAILEHEGGDEASRAEALLVKVDLAVVRGDHATGLEAAAEAGRRARDLHDDALLVRILANEAALEVVAGDIVAAHASSGEATQIAAGLGDDASFIAAAQAEAFIAFGDGDFRRGREVGLAAASRCRLTNDVLTLPVHLTSAGVGALMLGDHADAEEALIDALRASIAIDDRRGLVLRLEMLALSAATAGRAQRAAQLLGAAQMVRHRTAAQASPFTSRHVAQAEELAQSKLGQGDYAKAFEAGSVLDLDSALAMALGAQVAHARVDAVEAPNPLGKREREVATLIADGLSNKEIATRLFLSERTVETHVYNILNKLGFKSRVNIAAWVTAQ